MNRLLPQKSFMIKAIENMRKAHPELNVSGIEVPLKKLKQEELFTIYDNYLTRTTILAQREMKKILENILNEAAIGYANSIARGGRKNIGDYFPIVKIEDFWALHIDTHSNDE